MAVHTRRNPSGSIQVRRSPFLPFVAPLVWGVWLLLVIADVVFIGRYGTNLPFSDDFEMVPALCGVEDYPKWLWSWCAEHRVPIPRLIQHGLYKLTNNDFRAGMFFNVTALASLSAAMIWTARHIRGKARITDLFFPVVLLHWGQWENLLWSWQVQFVSSAVLGGVWLCIAVGSMYPMQWWRAFVASLCVVLLPLCGANGLALVPPLAFWLVVTGIWQLTSGRRVGGVVMIAGAAAALTVLYVYFIGFQKTAQSSPAIMDVIRTASEFLAIGFGPAASRYWPASAWFTVALACIGVILLLTSLSQSAVERIRALGILMFIGGIFALALGIGWGRANYGAEQGFSSRYVTLAAPLLCALYFTGELHSRGFLGRSLQIVLCIAAAVAFIPNTIDGLKHARLNRTQRAAFESAMAQGDTLSALAQHHTNSLGIQDWEQLREQFLRPLKEADIGTFREMRDDPKLREISFPIEPKRVLNAKWANGVLRSTSNDAYLVFELERPQFVYAIRFRFSYEGAAAPANAEFHWCESTRNNFADPGHHISWTQHAQLGEMTRTVWINDTIDLFRIDPDNKPCVFRLEEIEFLLPSEGAR